MPLTTFRWLRLPDWFPGARPKAIPRDMWRHTLQQYAFLGALSQDDQEQLRSMAARFMAGKEYAGAAGLEVTDDMAVAIAAQACLPVLHMEGNGLSLYDDFKGIVVHAGAMVAKRQSVDAAGVVHHYREILAGEAMEKGPVTLSWEDIAASGDLAERGHNVVIHEFVHKIDMRNGNANGCPPLSSGAARDEWQRVMTPAYARFRQQILMAQRFGAETPWLDAYGAQSPVEFFAVAAEAYFVNRPQFETDFPDVAVLFDKFFRPKQKLFIQGHSS